MEVLCCELQDLCGRLPGVVLECLWGRRSALHSKSVLETTRGEDAIMYKAATYNLSPNQPQTAGMESTQPRIPPKLKPKLNQARPNTKTFNPKGDTPPTQEQPGGEFVADTHATHRRGPKANTTQQIRVLNKTPVSASNYTHTQTPQTPKHEYVCHQAIGDSMLDARGATTASNRQAHAKGVGANPNMG